MKRKKLRIFISSPGDVIPERKIVKKVINDLDKIYSQYVELDTIMWEDLPLEATSSFQSGIDYFLNQAPIDIAVFILWSRLGSTLGRNFTKPDGSIYKSGTEYEFDTMHTLWERTQRPKIMVYVKDIEPQYPKTSAQVKEALAQKENLDNFIEEKFRDRETGTNYAYLQFDKQQQFEERVRIHLTRLIQDNIGSDITVREWEGNPYMGLLSYEAEHAPIFCGRKDLIYAIEEKISHKYDSDESPTIFVLGESGSGKSSLIKAGLIPHVLSIYSENNYVVRTFCPSEFCGNVYHGIVEELIKLYPDLEGTAIAKDLRKGIDNSFNFEYLQFAISKSIVRHSPIFFLDQFEELFTDSTISEEERQRCLFLLRGLSKTKRLWLVFSMRNDFYSKFSTYPELGLIRNEALVVDIPNVTGADITEIVKIPAKKANLKWEVDSHGTSLSKKIIEDATELKQLPLIEFALSELYELCQETGILTFSAYNQIGHLKGAVLQYVNKFYAKLSTEEKNELQQIMGAFVTFSTEKKFKFMRKTSRIDDITTNVSRKRLIDKLINAHLFVSGKDVSGAATVTLSHEILLNSWDVIRDWCKNQEKFVRENEFYEKQAIHWLENNKRKQELISERSSLLEAEYFLFRYEDRISSLVKDFLSKSLLTDRKRGLAKHVTALVGLLIMILCSLIYILIGTYGDADIDNAIGIEDIKWWDFILLFSPLLIASFRAVQLRRKPQYTYKTIKTTSILWVVNIAILVVSTCSDLFIPDRNVWVDLLFLIPFFFAAASVWVEYWRRRQWRNNKFVAYFTTDKFEAIKNIVLWASAFIIILFAFAIYGVVVTEKNEKFKVAFDDAEKLYTGLNNIQERLNWSENKFINESRMDFLRAVTYDELNDWTPDEFEGKYALCLYNLFEPFEAIRFLYPDSYLEQRYLYIATCMRAGLYDEAEKYIELCAESDEYIDYVRISTTNLIWEAEKIGRFDLAEKLKEIVDKNNSEILNDFAYSVNSGHIQLMKGNTNDAYACYDRAIQQYIDLDSSNNDAKKFIRNHLSNDFDIFRWLNVGNQALIKEACNHYQFECADFLTTVSDTASTNAFIKEVEGGWLLPDSTIEMHYYSESPLCQYRMYSKNKEGVSEEVYRGMTNIRCSRQAEHFYIEEFDPERPLDAISTGEIVLLDSTNLHILIIENGNPSDKGTIRTYKRM